MNEPITMFKKQFNFLSMAVHPFPNYDFSVQKFFRLQSMMGKRKSSFDIAENCPFVYTIFDLT